MIGATRAHGEAHTTDSGYRFASRHRVLSLVRVEPGDQPVACDTFNANFVLVPARTLEELGGNDPFYWHSFGDIDLGLSIQPGAANGCWSRPAGSEGAMTARSVCPALMGCGGSCGKG